MKIIVERENGSLRVITETPGESMTEQQHRDQVDINKICAKARRGVMPAYQPVPPNYGDFSSGMDLQGLMERVADAKADFMQLPSGVRKRFNHDPGELIDFLADESNRQEAIGLGLIASPEVKPVDTGDEVKSPQEPQAESEGGLGGLDEIPT